MVSGVLGIEIAEIAESTRPPGGEPPGREFYGRPFRPRMGRQTRRAEALPFVRAGFQPGISRSIPASEYLRLPFSLRGGWSCARRSGDFKFTVQDFFPNNERPSVMDTLRETRQSRLLPLEMRMMKAMPRLRTLIMGAGKPNLRSNPRRSHEETPHPPCRCSQRRRCPCR